MSHTTQDEIQFIKHLGKHTLCNENYQGPRDRQELLSGYLAGCTQRENWGGIDKDAVMEFAMSEFLGVS